MNIPNVAATPDCDCATCKYIRATHASQPAPNLLAERPNTGPVSPPLGGLGPWRCACGAMVYSHQVHTCGHQGFHWSVT